MFGAGHVAAIIMASLFLWSGLEKLRTLERSKDAFSAIDKWMPPQYAVVLISCAELVAAGCLVAAPDQVWTLALVSLLAVTFAAAGVWALATKRNIECACFGSQYFGRSKLGKPQLVWFGIWMVGIAIISIHSPVVANQISVAAGGLLMIFGMLMIRLVKTCLAARTSRGDRLSAERMYTWLH